MLKGTEEIHFPNVMVDHFRISRNFPIRMPGDYHIQEVINMIHFIPIPIIIGSRYLPLSLGILARDAHTRLDIRLVITCKRVIDRQGTIPVNRVSLELRLFQQIIFRRNA